MSLVEINCKLHVKTFYRDFVSEYEGKRGAIIPVQIHETVQCNPIKHNALNLAKIKQW